MAILGFILGSVGAAILLFLGYIIVTTATNYHDFEGATAMGFVFTILPIGALIGGIAGAILLPRLTRPRRAP